MELIKRSLAKTVSDASKTFKVILLTGPRQVGKTTLLQSLLKSGRTAVTLDDPDLRHLAKSDPELFLSTYPPPLLIDEIQYAPELFPYIKMCVDKSTATGQFWLTGSQPFLLMRGVSESLAGRVAILKLQGLDTAERNGRFVKPYKPQHRPKQPGLITTRLALAKRVFAGSFPQLTAQPKTDITLFMRSYTATYLSRDIRDLVKVEHEHEFMTFLTCLAARAGQLLNASNLSQDVGISPQTIRAWTSILESSGVIVMLRPYRTNLTKRATATPKVYFSDTGLATHLCGIRTPEDLERSQLFGHMAENYAVMEVLKSWWHVGLSCDASFYRDKEGHEIDLLIKDGPDLHPVEIKLSAKPNMSEIETNISALAKTKTKLSLGSVICLTGENRPYGRDLLYTNIGNIGL